MFRFKFKIYLRLLEACWTTFGFSKTLIRFSVFRPLFEIINKVAFALDHFFYPGFKKSEVKNPIFIMGHPRSGSTFLHRLLHQTGEFVAFKNWEIIFVSLVARKISAPIIEVLIKKKKNVIIPKETGHEQLLESIEEEELLLYKLLNTQFIANFTPLAFSEAGFQELVYSDCQPKEVRRKTACFLKSCFQRQMYLLQKQQLMANMNYSGMRIKTLLEIFPDAKFIYLIRSPYETIPSHLSLDRSVFDHLWGLENISEKHLRRYYERRYNYDVIYYKYVEDLFEKGVLNSSCCLTIPYEKLKYSLIEVFDDIVRFTGIQPSDALKIKIRHQAKSQKNYRPSHRKLSLEDFGLNKHILAKDLSFIFEKYGFAK